jgi:hypothetical protein
MSGIHYGKSGSRVKLVLVPPKKKSLKKNARIIGGHPN